MENEIIQYAHDCGFVAVYLGLVQRGDVHRFQFAATDKKSKVYLDVAVTAWDALSRQGLFRLADSAMQNLSAKE